MKVNDPNLHGNLGGIQGNRGAHHTAEAKGIAKPGTGRTTAPTEGDSSDGVQLSELVQSLRTLGAETPERDAHIEGIARAYAQGSYQVDAEATAGGMIDDALKHGGPANKS